MSKQHISNNRLGFKLDWNSDSERSMQACTSCKAGTKGQSGGKPHCLPCTLSEARKAAKNA